MACFAYDLCHRCHQSTPSISIKCIWIQKVLKKKKKNITLFKKNNGLMTGLRAPISYRKFQWGCLSYFIIPLAQLRSLPVLVFSSVAQSSPVVARPFPQLFRPPVEATACGDWHKRCVDNSRNAISGQELHSNKENTEFLFLFICGFSCVFLPKFLAPQQSWTFTAKDNEAPTSVSGFGHTDGASLTTCILAGYWSWSHTVPYFILL